MPVPAPPGRKNARAEAALPRNRRNRRPIAYIRGWRTPAGTPPVFAWANQVRGWRKLRFGLAAL